MIELPLTKGQVAIVDDEDVDLLTIKWYASLNRKTPYIRSTRKIGDKPLILHRVIMERALARTLTPKDIVDHIDGDTLNNRRVNLRLATHAENIRNRKTQSNNTTGYKGVTRSSRGYKYHAYINHNGKRIFLGSFSSAEEAYKAYCKAALEYYGEFARFDDV